MKGEIDKDFYCSGSYINYNNAGTPYCLLKSGEVYISKCCDCRCCHRKHPTPEQFKEEYGEEYPNDGAVYGRRTINDDKTIFADWRVMFFDDWIIQTHIIPKDVVIQTVCACTPFGKPDRDWRPK